MSHFRTKAASALRLAKNLKRAYEEIMPPVYDADDPEVIDVDNPKTTLRVQAVFRGFRQLVDQVADASANEPNIGRICQASVDYANSELEELLDMDSWDAKEYADIVAHMLVVLVAAKQNEKSKGG